MISQLKKDITGFFRKFFGLNNVDSLLTQVKNDSNVPIDESNENDEKDKVIANYKEELRKLQEDFQKDIKKEILNPSQGFNLSLNFDIHFTFDPPGRD